MKKKLLTLMLAFVLVVTCAFNFVACGDSDSSSGKDGTYYLYESGDYDKDCYIKISSGKVSDFVDRGSSAKDAGGKITSNLSGKSITITVTFKDRGAKYEYNGGINNGVIFIEAVDFYKNDKLQGTDTANMYYCRKNKTPADFSGSNSGNNKPSDSTSEDYTPDGFVPSDYPSDNFFKGAISEDSFSSANEAARAFLEVEVNGEATQAEFKSYNKKANLSKSEISSLNIELEKGSNITNAERGEIEYEDNAVAGEKYASKAGGVIAVKTKKVVIYIIEIDYSDYKYFAPELDAGDIITKSYYNEVFDMSKYANCTVNETSYAISSAAQSKGITQEAESRSDTTLYISETAMYAIFEISAVLNYYRNGTLMDSEDLSNMYMEMYAVLDDGEISELYTRSSRSARWQRNYSSVDMRNYILPKMDNSFFVKTDYGFSVNSEKYSLFVQKQINEIMSDMNYSYTELTINAGYRVKDGKIDASRLTLDGTYTVDGIEGVASSEMNTRFTDFGSTVVPTKYELEIDY